MTTLALLGFLLSCVQQAPAPAPAEVAPKAMPDTGGASAPDEGSEDVPSEVDAEYCEMLEECASWMKTRGALQLNSSPACAALGADAGVDSAAAKACRARSP